jgi:hypothetical protein
MIPTWAHKSHRIPYIAGREGGREGGREDGERERERENERRDGRKELRTKRDGMVSTHTHTGR